MNSSLRVAVADDEPLMRHWYTTTLQALGHEVVCAAENGRDLVQGCRDVHPDLVITDIEMPVLDGLAAIEEIQRNNPVPVILVSAHDDTTYIERALQNQVYAYLVKPIRKPNLVTAIAVVMERAKEARLLQTQADDLAQALEERKMVERAKGILMQRAGLGEQEAFRRLQKLSQERNQRLAEVAATIISAEEAFTSHVR